MTSGGYGEFLGEFGKPLAAVYQGRIGRKRGWVVGGLFAFLGGEDGGKIGERWKLTDRSKVVRRRVGRSGGKEESGEVVG